jgi:ribosome-binding factor A
MINNSSVAAIKKAQKESLLLKKISSMFHTILIDDTRLDGLFVNRVELSADKGWVTVYFYTLDGQEKFEEQHEILKLYKPSIRKGLADQIKGRYVPDLKFAYDLKFERQQRLERVMSQAAHETEEYKIKQQNHEDAA